MTDIITFSPVVALDANGLPVANATAEFFNTGTTTPATVYQDAEETTPHASPLVADGDGFFPAVFKSGDALKVVVKTPLGATLYTLDPAVKVPSSGSSASVISFSATPEIPQTNVQDAIVDVEGKKANKANPALTGTPTAPTPATATDSTQIATTAYVRAQVLDEDDFASDDPARPPSQQSVAAYVNTLPLAKLYESTAQTMIPGGLLTLPHGFGEDPKLIRLRVVCVTADDGYAVGDKIDLSATILASDESQSSYGLTVYYDSTNIYVRNGNNAVLTFIGNKANGSVASIDRDDFVLHVEAFA